MELEIMEAGKHQTCFCKINHLLIHLLNIFAKLTVQGAKYILHTHTKKRRKKSSRKMGSSPQFFKSKSMKWHHHCAFLPAQNFTNQAITLETRCIYCPSQVFLASPH
jgi:hypothetical protein